MSKKPWKGLKPDSTLFGAPVVEENLNGFYQFMYERHMIWVRRFMQELPPPWTKDLILQKYKFTNVYRELDWGTVWYMEHIWGPLKTQYEAYGTYNYAFATGMGEELLWQTVLYRLLNRVETFEEVGIPTYRSWPDKKDEFRKKLESIKASGRPVFTDAHLTLPTRLRSKIAQYMKSLNAFYPKALELAWDSSSADSLRSVFLILKKIPSVGSFISYEVCTDLVNTFFRGRFTEDDWANAGPGCKVGIEIIFPDRKSISYEDAISKLRKEQRYHFARLGLNFPYLVVSGAEKELTLRCIEHSLCEFGKFWKMKHHCGKSRQRFKPKDWGQLGLKFL